MRIEEFSVVSEGGTLSNGSAGFVPGTIIRIMRTVQLHLAVRGSHFEYSEAGAAVRALRAEPPVFAHVPLILGADKSRFQNVTAPLM